MHLGGKIEMESKHPIRNRDDLSMIYTPGVARVCLAIAEQPRGRPPADHQAQQRRGRHRRLRRPRPGQHRPEGRAAGDGGQGGALQAVRRHRRLAAVPGHPGHRRDRRRSSRRSPPASPASTSRTSPRRAASRSRRGCARPWTSRSSTTTSTAPRSSCSPRSTNALRVVGKDDQQRAGRHVRCGRGRYGDPEAADRGRRQGRGRRRHRTASSTPDARPGDAAAGSRCAGSRRTPTPKATPAR